MRNNLAFQQIIKMSNDTNIENFEVRGEIPQARFGMI